MQINITVRDFNYYVGHAYASLSRLHVNMFVPPPRVVRLAAPHKTEMRQMMQQFRPRPPGMGVAAPSGYIVDISRDDDESGGQSSERRSTRAVINRGVGGAPDFAGGFPRLDGLFGGMGLPGEMGQGDGSGDPATGGGGTQGDGSGDPATGGGGTQGDSSGDPATGGGGTQGDRSGGDRSGDPATGGGGTQGDDEKMKVDDEGKPSEVRSKQEVKEDNKQEVSDGEEVRSKNKEEMKTGEEVKSKINSKREEPKKETETPSDKKDDNDEETPQYLARLLSELITGVADPVGPYRPTNKPKEEENGEGGTTGALSGGITGAESVASDKDRSSGDGGAEGEGDGRRRTFAERYAGPEGTTVTISAAPVPPYGIPGLPPMEGPSVSIKNRGDGEKPEMTINFPMPPALQLLQSLLERAEERHRQRREAGETSSEEDSDDDDDDDDGGGGGGGGGEGDKGEVRGKKEKKKDTNRIFIDDDGEVKSISDAGSLDVINSDDEQLPEFEDISSLPGNSDTPHAEDQSMEEVMEEVRNKLAPSEGRGGEERDLGVMEEILKVISRELSVMEVMQVMRGDVGPVERIQPCLVKFIQDRLLDGVEPTQEHRDKAVSVLLAGCKPALLEVESDLPLRDSGIDFPTTLHHLLSQICSEAYDHITRKYNREESLFGPAMREWAVCTGELFSSVVRHCVDGEEKFEEMINKLIGTLFPPNAPSMILDMCCGSILKEMVCLLTSHPYTPQELEGYVHWKKGTVPTANTSYGISNYSVGHSTIHSGQMIPVPAKESCPGGPCAANNNDDDDDDRGSEDFPHGVPEEWMPSIKRDRRSHCHVEGPQQPYSEAYLAGMPAKRRKQLDTSDPEMISPKELSLKLMEEALIETGAETVTGKSPLEMLSMFHHHDALPGTIATDVFNIQRDRCLSVPSFNKDTYPNSTKFYKLSSPK